MAMLEGIWLVLAYTLAAGAMIPVGAMLSRSEHLRHGHFRNDVLHAIVAFGGGALLSAVALVLVPEGVAAITLGPVIATFTGGALAFLLIDRAIERRGGRAAQLMAMVMDFVPESIALGAAVAFGGATGPLLALLIGVQNLPEGFNAYRELRQAGLPAARTLSWLSPLALLGPAAGVLGFFVLSSSPALVGGLMLFAAGGILYLLFHDVAPLAHRGKHWVPTLAAVAGFLVGIVGQAVIHTA